MSKTYLRGDLYYADLGHGIGSEQKGTRPVVIIQNNVGNKHSPTVIIAAVTSKANVKAKLPTHYYLDAGNGLVGPVIVQGDRQLPPLPRRAPAEGGHTARIGKFQGPRLAGTQNLSHRFTP